MLILIDFVNIWIYYRNRKQTWKEGKLWENLTERKLVLI